MRQRKESGKKVYYNCSSGSHISLASDILLVLREIEREDNIWHEKQKSAQKSEKTTTEAEKQPTQRSKGKEPAMASAEDETKKTPSTRKVNFF